MAGDDDADIDFVSQPATCCIDRILHQNNLQIWNFSRIQFPFRLYSVFFVFL